MQKCVSVQGKEIFLHYPSPYLPCLNFLLSSFCFRYQREGEMAVEVQSFFPWTKGLNPTV